MNKAEISENKNYKILKLKLKLNQITILKQNLKLIKID